MTSTWICCDFFTKLFSSSCSPSSYHACVFQTRPLIPRSSATAVYSAGLAPGLGSSLCCCCMKSLQLWDCELPQTCLLEIISREHLSSSKKKYSGAQTYLLTLVHMLHHRWSRLRYSSSSFYLNQPMSGGKYHHKTALGLMCIWNSASFSYVASV